MTQTTTESIQLEAREQELARRAEQTKFALAAIDEARAGIQHALRGLICPELDAALLALDEAIEQLEGRAAP